MVSCEKTNWSLIFNVNRKIQNRGSTTGMVGTRIEIFLLTLTTNDGFYLFSFRIIKYVNCTCIVFWYIAVLTGKKFDVPRAYNQRMYDGYVNKHRPQHHFSGNDKNLNKNKRIQIRYQAFITSVCVCVCMTILSDCDSCSSRIILTDYTHWFLIIVLLTTWILRAMHVWAGLNSASKRDRWFPSIALIASFALHQLDWLSSK